jgi:hypothetical protein
MVLGSQRYSNWILWSCYEHQGKSQWPSCRYWLAAALNFVLISLAFVATKHGGGLRREWGSLCSQLWKKKTTIDNKLCALSLSLSREKEFTLFRVLMLTKISMPIQINDKWKREK